jgi:hypothetical protein
MHEKLDIPVFRVVDPCAVSAVIFTGNGLCKSHKNFLIPSEPIHKWQEKCTSMRTPVGSDCTDVRKPEDVEKDS